MVTEKGSAWADTIQLEFVTNYMGKSVCDGILPNKRPLGVCRWMGSHFHDWIDYHGVAFSIELLEWGGTFSDFWGKTVFHIYGLPECLYCR